MDEAANRSKEQMGQLIVHTEVLHIDPLAMKIPIIDWFMVYQNNRSFYKIIRADKSENCYSNPTRVIKAVNREDLEEMYKIGMRKYGDRQGKQFDANFLLFELLEIMFEPEKVQEKVTRYTPILDWIHYANCGVYSISRNDGNVEFYLVEKEYKHGLNVLMNMLQVKLRADSNSREAMDLIWKITTQIRKLRES